MKRFTRFAATGFAIAALGLTVPGCDEANESPTEKLEEAGQELHDGVQTMKDDAMETADDVADELKDDTERTFGEKVEEGLEETGETIKDGLKDAGEKLEAGFEKLKDSVNDSSTLTPMADPPVGVPVVDEK